MNILYKQIAIGTSNSNTFYIFEEPNDHNCESGNNKGNFHEIEFNNGDKKIYEATRNTYTVKDKFEKNKYKESTFGESHHYPSDYLSFMSVSCWGNGCCGDFLVLNPDTLTTNQGVVHVGPPRDITNYSSNNPIITTQPG